MSKSKRIEKRINRIEDRFKKKVAKGKKGTDMDIELHERRIQDLRDKSPLNYSFGAAFSGAGSTFGMNPGNTLTGNASGPGNMSFIDAFNMGINGGGENNSSSRIRGGLFGAANLAVDPFAGPQIGTSDQIANSASANRDVNNTSSSSWSGVGPIQGVQANVAGGNPYVPGAGQMNEFNTPNRNFVPQAVNTANSIYGNNQQRTASINTQLQPYNASNDITNLQSLPKKLITL